MLKPEEATGVLMKLVIIGEFLIHKAILPIQPFFEPMLMQACCGAGILFLVLCRNWSANKREKKVPTLGLTWRC